MEGKPWTRVEVELIVRDYLAMLASELAGVRYNKAAHRRELKKLLPARSDQSIEFKHCNISAVLHEINLPPIIGYKRRGNYQELLSEVVQQAVLADVRLQQLAAADVERPTVVPEVENILSILKSREVKAKTPYSRVAEHAGPVIRLPTNYFEREARNRSLGLAGEQLVLNYERARLIHAGEERLAGKVEHTAIVQGDYAGYDILSFETNGAERLIEVKTSRYAEDTPFFVTRNELETSRQNASQYWLYRLFQFHRSPGLFSLRGSFPDLCELEPATFSARLR